jgi:haloacetate dehalogenase
MIADDLASKFTVVAADLRGKFACRFIHTSLHNRKASGYGDSSKPRGSESHIEYSKKEMAADQVGLM